MFGVGDGGGGGSRQKLIKEGTVDGILIESCRWKGSQRTKRPPENFPVFKHQKTNVSDKNGPRE